MRELIADVFAGITVMLFIAGFGRILRWVWFESSMGGWLIGLITIIFSLIMLFLTLTIAQAGNIE